MNEPRWEEDHLPVEWQTIGTETPATSSIVLSMRSAERRERALSLAELLVLGGLTFAGGWALLRGPAISDLWWAAAWIAVLLLVSTVSLLSAARNPRPLLATTAQFLRSQRVGCERREKRLQRGFRLLALESLILAPFAISRLAASPEAAVSHHGLGSMVSTALLLAGSLWWTGGRLAATRIETARLAAIEDEYGSPPDQTSG